MNEIICPNCKTAFKIEEAGFADILKQVRDHEFEEELAKKTSLQNPQFHIKKQEKLIIGYYY